MTKIAIQRQGELALAVTQCGQGEDHEFIKLFNNIEEVEFALKDSHQIIPRLNTYDLQQLAKKRLNMAKDFFTKGSKVESDPVAATTSKRVSHDSFTSEGANNSTVLGESTVPLSSTQGTTTRYHSSIETDKGTFHHMDSWKSKLQSALRHMDGFDEIFAMACMSAKVDPTIQFISESKKKVINSNLSECSAKYIEKLTSKL